MTEQTTSTYFHDTIEEMEKQYNELINNSDFSYLGGFDLIQDIYEELECQGFSDKEVTQLTNNQYGNVLEILECPNNQYHAFIGAR